jgi:diacylglycerol kinase family enzyme
MPSLESVDAGAVLALEAPVRRKRMLVIANPYATTVSARLKSLVVYALQGRYDGRHRPTPRAATTRPRCAVTPRPDGYDVVVAFGGDGTVTRWRTGWPARPPH